MTDSFASSLRAGAVAGVVAGLPMSVTEVAVRALLDSPQRVPCSRTVAGLEERLHLSLSEPAHLLATTIGHVAYSALGGAVFGAVMHAAPTRRSAVVDVVAGTAFSFALQAVTYGAVLPTASILPPPPRMNRDFHVMNIVAHAAWGLAMGAAFRASKRNPLWGLSPRRSA